jgi:hypothetical protein
MPLSRPMTNSPPCKAPRADPPDATMARRTLPPMCGGASLQWPPLVVLVRPLRRGFAYSGHGQ